MECRDSTLNMFKKLDFFSAYIFYCKFTKTAPEQHGSAHFTSNINCKCYINIIWIPRKPELYFLN